MKQGELIDLAQQASGLNQTDVGAKCGINKARMTQLKNGTRPVSNDEARRLAEVAGLPWAEVIAALEVERAKDMESAQAWGKALARLRGDAGVALPGLSVVLALIAGAANGVFVTLTNPAGLQLLTNFKTLLLDVLIASPGGLSIMEPFCRIGGGSLTHETMYGCYNGPVQKSCLAYA